MQVGGVGAERLEQRQRVVGRAIMVDLALDPRSAMTPDALVRVEKTIAGRGYRVEGGTPERGATALPLGAGPTEVRLVPRAG